MLIERLHSHESDVGGLPVRARCPTAAAARWAPGVLPTMPARAICRPSAA
jgi:hypothetical protein